MNVRYNRSLHIRTLAKLLDIAQIYTLRIHVAYTRLIHLRITTFFLLFRTDKIFFKQVWCICMCFIEQILFKFLYPILIVPFLNSTKNHLPSTSLYNASLDFGTLLQPLPRANSFGILSKFTTSIPLSHIGMFFVVSIEARFKVQICGFSFSGRLSITSSVIYTLPLIGCSTRILTYSTFELAKPFFDKSNLFFW